MAKTIASVVKPILQAKGAKLSSFSEGRIHALDRAFSAKKITIDEVIKSLDEEFYRYLNRTDFDKIRKELR